MDSDSETSCLCKPDITITLAVNPTEVITLSLTSWVRGFSALTNFGYTLYPKLNCRSKTCKTLKQKEKIRTTIFGHPSKH